MLVLFSTAYKKILQRNDSPVNGFHQFLKGRNEEGRGVPDDPSEPDKSLYICSEWTPRGPQTT